MLRPKLSKDHWQRLSEVRAELSAALQASGLQASPAAAPLQTKRAELTARLEQLQRSADLETLAAAAEQTNHLQTQVGILDKKIDEAQRMQEANCREQESEAYSIACSAIALLSEVALDSLQQHRDHLMNRLADYSAGDRGIAARLSGLVPWFNVYRRRIDNFRLQVQPTSDEQLLAYLESALKGTDFLAPRTATQEHEG